MAKRVKQRAAVGVLGKDLTRRSRGRCELCESKSEVRAWEIPPFPEEPEMDRALMTCGRCRGWLEGEEIQPNEARFLATAVWAECVAIRDAAELLLRRLAESGDPWVLEAIDVIENPIVDEDEAPWTEEVQPA